MLAQNDFEQIEVKNLNKYGTFVAKKILSNEIATLILIKESTFKWKCKNVVKL